MAKVIDCTPTWKSVLPLLLENLRSGNPEVYKNAMIELNRMAHIADKFVEVQKVIKKEVAKEKAAKKRVVKKPKRPFHHP